MSIARQLFREFRPFFRMLDEPFYRRAPPGLLSPEAMRRLDRENRLADPFVGLNMMTSPAVDVMEKGDKYILDADLPGVSRENLQVRLGDGNQSITIEGKVTEKLSSGASESGAQASGKSNNVTDAEYTDGMCIRLNLPLLEAYEGMQHPNRPPRPEMRMRHRSRWSVRIQGTCRLRGQYGCRIR
jgi:HSP20 family molecular chaperone IbpA